MERRRQRLTLAHQHRIFAFGRDHFHALANAFDLRSADEYHFNGFVKKSAFADRAVDLASVSIAAHRDVERSQAGLLRVLYFRCEKDASRARAEGRLRIHEILQLRETIFTEKLEECSRLASGNHQAVDVSQLLRFLNQNYFRAEFF